MRGTRYLTPEEKRIELQRWSSDEHADPGVRPLMDRLNAIAGVCTQQCCIGHEKVSKETGARYVESGCIEMRLDARRTSLFYDGMPTLRSLPDVEDVTIGWRTPYQVCTVWFRPGLMSAVVDALVEVLAPSPTLVIGEGASSVLTEASSCG